MLSNLNIQFDEELHRYSVGGRSVPSVTQILRGVGIIDDRWFKSPHATRGTYAHKACHFYDENDLDFETLDDIVKPYVEGYINFRETSGFKPTLIEKIVFDPYSWYAGMLDRTGILNGEAVLIDIKTGSLPGWVGLQTAGYLKALQNEIGPVPHKRFALQLKSDGKYNLSTEYKDRNDINVFLAATTVFNYKQGK